MLDLVILIFKSSLLESSCLSSILLNKLFSNRLHTFEQNKFNKSAKNFQLVVFLSFWLSLFACLTFFCLSGVFLSVCLFYWFFSQSVCTNVYLTGFYGCLFVFLSVCLYVFGFKISDVNFHLSFPNVCQSINTLFN